MLSRPSPSSGRKEPGPGRTKNRRGCEWLFPTRARARTRKRRCDGPPTPPKCSSGRGLVGSSRGAVDSREDEDTDDFIRAFRAGTSCS